MLNFQGSTPVTGQPYPFQGMFRVEAQDDQGQPLPDVCVELEARKADGMVANLLTATRQDGGFPLRVLTPEGENSLFVVSAGKDGFGWRQAAAPPIFSWTHYRPLTGEGMRAYRFRAQPGCLHDQPDQSQFQILWGLTAPAGDPFAAAVLTMTISGPGVLQPTAVGTTDPNGQAQLISRINRYGDYDGYLTGVTGPDGTDLLPNATFDGPNLIITPEGRSVFRLNVGAQCTPP